MFVEDRPLCFPLGVVLFLVDVLDMFPVLLIEVDVVTTLLHLVRAISVLDSEAFGLV